MAEEQNNQNSRLQFEDIVPWGQTGGDTGLSSRLKLKRNFERIKLWADNITFAIQNIGNGHYLSKEEDDEAAGEIGFLKGFWVKVKNLFGIDGDGNAKVNSLTVNEDFGIDENGNAKINNLNASGDAVIDGDERVKGMLNVDGNIVSKAQVEGQGAMFNQMQSPAFGGHTSTGSGWGITDNYGGTGRSRLTIDELYVRGRFIAEQLEAKKKTVSGGDELQSCAASYISSVDIIDPQGNIMGYQRVKVPWLLGIKRLLSGDLNTFGKIWSMTKNVYVGVTENNIREVEQQNPNGLLRVRCYFLAKDGEREIDNWWRVGDLAFCQTLDLANQQNRLGYGAGRAHSASSNIRWWRKVVAVSQTPYKIGSQEYHWFDVEFNMSREAQLLENSTWCEMGSDIPAAHDSVVHLGHMPQASEIVNGEATDDATGRMNALSIEVNGAGNEDAPCVKILYGIYGYSLQECWFGGPVVRMLLSPRKGYFFYGPEFHFITQEDVVRVVIDRPEGEWSKIAFTKGEMGQSETYPGYSDDIKNDDGTFKSRYHEAGASDIDKNYVRKVHYWERVTHKGALWLCIKQDTSYWYDKVEQKRVASPNVQDMSRYERRLSYVSSEPSVENSEEWLRQVNRGTGIVSETFAYACSPTYVVVPEPTDNPTLTWYDTEAAMIAAKNPVSGWWLYERRTVTYSDTLKPQVTYSVRRMGIDGDGIAEINSYYLGTDSNADINAQNDRYPIQPRREDYDTQAAYDAALAVWTAADSKQKWYDTYADMVTGNGGIANMGGWYIWEKTLITYDTHYTSAAAAAAAGKRIGDLIIPKPVVTTYRCNRMGTDAVVGQEEYYMLAASNDFKTVFGNGSVIDYSYAKTGIRWYNKDNPAGAKYRLAEGTAQDPNINTQMWASIMPTYNKATHGNKIYLWNFEWHVDGNGTEYAMLPICIGNHARGIVGVIELYACSNSKSPRSGGKIPSDIYSANGNSETSYIENPDASQQANLKVWSDERYDRAPTDALPYQWNWTRTLYSTKDANGKDYEDHYHVSAVKGTKGEDGAGTEYIYKLSTDGSYGTHPKNITSGTIPGTDGRVASNDKTKDDWVPDGWTDNPSGIRKDAPIELVSQRTKATGGTWGAFSDPQTFSHWGRNGQDGDGVEYVFMRTKKNVAPTIVLVANQTADSASRNPKDREYLPSITNKDACEAESTECTDDPKNINENGYVYEWVAIRRKVKTADWANTGELEWEQYSGKMSLWKNWSQSSFKSTMFVRMNATPTKPADNKGSYSNPSPTDCKAGKNSSNTDVYWSDGIPEGNNILWATTRIFTDDGQSPQQASWSTPRQMTDTDTYDVEFAKMQANDATPATPTTANRHGGTGTQIWFDPALDSSEDFTKMYWRAERECINGVWGNWTILRIKGEKGNTGSRGDFKSRVFCRTNTNIGSSSYIPTGGSYDTPWPGGAEGASGQPGGLKWYDGIPSGTAQIWSSVRTFKGDGSSTSWSIPQPESDTADIDIEFSPKTDKPAVSTLRTTVGGQHPSTNTWYDPSALPSGQDMIWRAERKIKNGVFDGDWVISRIKGEKGDPGGQGGQGPAGQSSFTSTVFCRTNLTPQAPESTRGSFSQPSPTDSNKWPVKDSSGNTISGLYWSDGIPDGNQALWESRRVFTSDGNSPQQASWSTPRKVEDTKDYDVEFCPYTADNKPSGVTFTDGLPPTPSASNRHKSTSPYTGQVWFDPNDDKNSLPQGIAWSDMIWRAERECTNGNWSSWVISRIKGEQGEPGQGTPGSDGWTIVANPANVIMNQDTSNTSSFGTPVAVEFVAKHGNNTATVSFTKKSASQVSVGQSGNSWLISGPTKDSNNNYYDRGNVVFTVTATDGTNSVTMDVTIYCYFNLLGKWKQTIENGVETSVSTKLNFRDENDQIMSLQQVGTYIRGYEANIANLQKTDGNMLDCATGSGWRGWNSGDEVPCDNATQMVDAQDDGNDVFSTAVYLVAGTTYVFSAYCPVQPSFYYCFCGPELSDAESIDGGSAFQSENGFTSQKSDDAQYQNCYRYYGSFTPAETGYYMMEVYRCQYFYRPMLQAGTIPTTWTGGGRNYASEIKQTAEAINLSIRNGLTQTGIDITNKKIDVKADNFTIKNNAGKKVLGTNADGDLEVEGTIKAKNFFHRVCIAMKIDNSAGDYSVKYTASAALYITNATTFKNDTNVSGYVNIKELNKISTGMLVDLTDTTNFPTLINQYNNNAAFDGAVPCVGYADVVFYITTQTTTGTNPIILPPASKSVGKVVSVYNKSYNNNTALTVKSANSNDIVSPVAKLNSGTPVVDGNTGQSISLSKDEWVIMYALENGWMAVAKGVTGFS